MIFKKVVLDFYFEKGLKSRDYGLFFFVMFEKVVLDFSFRLGSI